VKKSAVSAAGLVAGQPTDGPEPVDEQEAVKVADLMLPEAGRSSRNLYDGMTKEKAKILESLFDKYKEMLAKNAERHSSAAGSRGRRR
jgi:hypothetical protein